jgi:hypothetical protein
MCSAPKAPKIPKAEPLPTSEPLPTTQQAPPPPPLAPVQAMQAQPVAPPTPPPVPMSQAQAPPPVQVEGQSTDQPIVKKRKSKRKELQQASKGASALRIPLTKKLGSVASGSTGSTGLNIPS